MKCTRNILWWILFLSVFGTFFAFVWLAVEVVFGDPKTSVVSDEKETLFDKVLFFFSLPYIFAVGLIRAIFFDKNSAPTSPCAYDKDNVSDRACGYDLGEKHLSADDEYYIYHEFINK